MVNITKCTKCDGPAIISAREARHDEERVEVEITCTKCQYTCFAFLGKEDFIGEDE